MNYDLENLELGSVPKIPEGTKLCGHGYRHLPLQKKIAYLARLYGRVTVCDDVQEDHVYFREHFNPNKEDCCDLRV